MPSSEYASEIHRLLKIPDPGSQNAGLPEDLPVAETHSKEELPKIEQPAHHLEFVPEKVRTLKFRGLIIYPTIFIVAFIIFYAALNFSSLVSQVEGFFMKPQEEVVLGDQLVPYYQWISGYYFSVGDSKLLEPNNDIDKDGYPDGTEIINYKNPWGSGNMSETQKKLAENIDLSLINNRVSFNTYEQSLAGQVLGANTFNYDLEKPGKLSIPRLSTQVPLVWSKEPANFENDLTQGVVHYPGTALPGELGTIYVSGHSSDYIWKKNPYRQVFAKLNYLKPGDDIFIELFGVDGKTYNYRYQVMATKIYAPDDQNQFIDGSGKILNLSTCWPIGTQKDRLVVTAVQVGL